jgi:phosphoglycolate phosphatase (TIGR01487 family)
MKFTTLATDYDGTIATHGVVDGDTLDALKRAKDAGITLLLVTGRELESLHRTFAHVDLFDLVVLENGALLHYPKTKSERALCDPPPEKLIFALRDRNVHPLSIGRVIVATFEPHETTVLECIRELGFEQQVIFNKGAVMVLPPGINKASGLKAALEELSISPEQVAAVGDAENDHALLAMCGFGVAVSNALPALKEHADWVSPGDHGRGVAQLIDLMISGDLETMPTRPEPVASMPLQMLGDDADVHPDA